MGIENTAGAPGNGGAGDTGAGANGNPPIGGGEGKVSFTAEQQEAVNRIVSSRVNEVKNQFTQAQEDSRILQNLVKDPEFQAWLNGDKGASTPSGGAQDPVQSLLEKEELSGKEVVQLVQQLLGKEVAPLRNTVDQVVRNTQAVGMDTTLQRMAGQVNPKTGQPVFPYLWDDDFRKDVMGLIGKRASNPEDAYYLAQRDREASGKGVPQSAFLMEGSGRLGRSPRGGLLDEEPEDVTLEGLGLQPKANIKQILAAVIDRKSKTGG